MGIDWNAVGTVCGNLVGFGIIGKQLMRGVEKSNETLPVITQNLKTLNKGLEELFNSRNDHDKRLERVETVHELRGCNEPMSIHTHRRSTD